VRLVTAERVEASSGRLCNGAATAERAAQMERG